jgi:hypothetical protein
MEVSGQFHIVVALTSWKKSPVKNFIRYWVEFRAGLEAEEKGKLSALAGNRTVISM